jgi:hypothetical protein
VRTHLLHVVSATADEPEFVNDMAANDGMMEEASTAGQPALSLVAAPGPLQVEPMEIRNACAADDEYWLGGYAGI